MKYDVSYWCDSRIGRVRSVHQDNFVCDGQLMAVGGYGLEAPLSGRRTVREACLFGVFDGMGGEECGEVASYIAARDAAMWRADANAMRGLDALCQRANRDICAYADTHGVGAMGTTAAMLAFAKKEIVLCNIGDSRIFRFRDGALTQLSIDHVSFAAYGVKPPLSQNLGIPPTELVIEPYRTALDCRAGDVYLLCSDGLTDMVDNEHIAGLLSSRPLAEAGRALMDAAMDRGGRDNTTILLCRVERHGVR